jgi:hypothetical protein
MCLSFAVLSMQGQGARGGQKEDATESLVAQQPEATSFAVRPLTEHDQFTAERLLARRPSNQSQYRTCPQG